MKSWSHLPLFSHGPGTPLAYLGHGVAGARAAHRQFRAGGEIMFHDGILAFVLGRRGRGEESQHLLLGELPHKNSQVTKDCQK